MADWEYIKTCVAAAQPVPLFGNGDVLSYEDYDHLLHISGVDGIMIARYMTLDAACLTMERGCIGRMISLH